MHNNVYAHDCAWDFISDTSKDSHMGSVLHIYLHFWQFVRFGEVAEGTAGETTFYFPIPRQPWPFGHKWKSRWDLQGNFIVKIMHAHTLSSSRYKKEMRQGLSFFSEFKSPNLEIPCYELRIKLSVCWTANMNLLSVSP